MSNSKLSLRSTTTQNFPLEDGGTNRVVANACKYTDIYLKVAPVTMDIDISVPSYNDKLPSPRRMEIHQSQ
jgi:hypothetical protein